MNILILDTEANSLTPDKIWCIVLKGFKKQEYYVFCNDTYIGDVTNDVMEQWPSGTTLLPLSGLKEFIHANYRPETLRIVGHNIIDYDSYWLLQLGIVDLYSVSSCIRDTYVLSRLAYPKRPNGHSVESWGQRFGLVKQEIGDEQWAKFDPVMITRCIKDCEIQDVIYDHLRTKELKGFSLQSIELEHETQKIISQQRRDGVYCDPQKTNTLYALCKRRADKMEEEIQSVFPPRPVLEREYNPKLTKDGKYAENTLGPIKQQFGSDSIVGPYSYFHYEPFNPGSPSQRVSRLLELGWVPTEFTKPSKTHPDGQPKFTEDSLESLPEDAPREIKLIGKYLMTRSRQGLADQILTKLDNKGYLHGYVDIIGAATHRMASNSPNLQNIPSAALDKQDNPIYGEEGLYGYECRDLFTIEDINNNILIDADASGIQLRGLAHYGQDTEYINLVSNPDIDIHRVHADVLQCSRSVAKTFIYALLMGAGIKKLASVLGSGDIKLGKELLELFYKRFRFLKELKKAFDKEANRGYTTLLDGRLCGLDQDRPHLVMSVKLQSFEAIVMKTGMCLFHQELKRLQIPFKQRLMIHDEYLVESRKIDAPIVGKMMVKGIEDAGKKLGSLCPLTGQYKIGPTWACVH